MNKEHIPRLLDFDSLEKCSRHPKNFIIYYCDTHDDVICHECISIGHDACATKNIDDINRKEIEKDFKSLIEEIVELKNIAEETRAGAVKDKLQSDICLSTVLHDIRSFKEDIIVHLERMEHDVSEAAKQLNLDFKMAMNEIIDDSKSMLDNVEHMLGELKDVETKRAKLFIKLNQKKSEIGKYKHEFNRSRSFKKTQSFIFQSNKKLTEIFRTTNSLGEIILEEVSFERNTEGIIVDSKKGDLAGAGERGTVTGDEHSNMMRASDHKTPESTDNNLTNEECFDYKSNVSERVFDREDELVGRKHVGFIDEFGAETRINEECSDEFDDFIQYRATECKPNAKLLSDKVDCDISGIDMLSENELIVSDYNNRSVKVLNMKEGQIVDELKLDFHPYDLTVPEENTVAVTLTNTIQVIHRSHLLRLGESIKVDGDCYGITSRNDKLFVSFVKPRPKIEILNLYGEILQRLELGSFEGRQFKRPRYISVCPNGTNIYLTDFETDSVVHVTIVAENLKVSEVFCDTIVLNGPYGIHVASSGHVFVCNYGNDNVYVFAADLSRYKLVLSKYEAIESPQAIYCDARHGELVVACTDNADCNQLQIFSTKSNKK